MVKRMLILFIVSLFVSFAAGCFANNSGDEILGYMSMTKSELIKKLGNNYKIVQTGAEASYEGYSYPEIGIIIVFDDTEKVNYISCNEKVNIKGTRAGMNFTQIQQALGKSKIYEIPDEESGRMFYEMRYNMGNFNLIYMSTKKDGSKSSLTIQRIDVGFAPDPSK